MLGGLVAPSLALGRQPTPKAKLIATPGSAFPDRTYVLRLPPRPEVPRLFLTENGGPVSHPVISAPEGSASGTYLVSYRSLLPPERKVVVRAMVTGFPAATATYTTPAFNVTASENSERRWLDSPYVTIFVVVALLALMPFALLSRLKHPD